MLALGVLLAGMAAAAAGNELPATATGPLTEAAQSWARAQRPATAAGTTLLQATDPRVAMTACPGGWQFDLPFTDTQTVRARCTQPQLQIFLRATLPLRGAEARSTPSAAPVAAAPESKAPPAPALAPAKREGTALAAAGRPADTAPRPVLTLRQDLRRGALLEAQNVAPARIDIPLQRGLGDPVVDPATLEHMELVRDKLAGQVLYSHDLQPALLVRKGQLIVVTAQAVPGLSITARLEALQDGRIGDTVRLRNRDSGRIVSGVVIGPNAARMP